MTIPAPRLVGYRRVSTEDQAERGSSLEAQSGRIRGFVAGLPGRELVEIVDDAGESARSLDRPGLERALAMLDAGQASGLVVANLDRLTRHVGDMVHLVERHFLAPAGPVLLSASEPVETRTAVGRMQIYILATVSQYQREAGAERTAGVMRSKRRGREATGNPAFGSKLDPSDPRRSKGGRPIALVESPEDRATLSIIRRLRLEGMTLREIAADLNARGIPAKRGVTRRSTGRWSKSSVHAILTRTDPDPDTDPTSEGDR